MTKPWKPGRVSGVGEINVMNDVFNETAVYCTFHVADGTIAFVELEVRGVCHTKEDPPAMTTTLV